MSCCNDRNPKTKPPLHKRAKYNPVDDVAFDWDASIESRRQHRLHTQAAVSMWIAEFPNAEINVTFAQQRYSVRMGMPPNWLLLRSPKNWSRISLELDLNNKVVCSKCGRYLKFIPFRENFVSCRESNPMGYTCMFSCEPRIITKRFLDDSKNVFLSIPPDNNCNYHFYCKQDLMTIRDLVLTGQINELEMIEGKL